MSTLAARHPSFSAAQTQLLQSRSVGAVPDNDVEPSEEWKQDLRQRIEDGLQDMVQDAKNNFDSKKGSASGIFREQLEQEFAAAMSGIRRLAAEQFQIELERERQERRWAAGIALTPGWDEALKQEQQSILDTIQKAGRPDDPLMELSPHSPRPHYTTTQPTDITRPPPPLPETSSRRDAREPYVPPYPGTPSISDSATRRDGHTRTTDAYRSPRAPDSASRREGYTNGTSRTLDYGGLTRDRDALSIRSSDSGYATGTTVVDEPEDILPPRPKRRSDASTHLERPVEDVDRPPEPSGRPFERPLARSLSDRHANSPPRVPELWKPSISPEEDIASSRPYQMNRRGSTASMKSNNSGSASYRAPSTNPIPERIREHVEGEGERERDKDRDREKSKSQEVQLSWAHDKPRERQDSSSFRTDNRQGSISAQPRRPQTVEELEYQSMQHSGAYSSWFTDPNARVAPPPSARLDSAVDHSPRVTDVRYQTHRSVSRPHIPDEFDFRLPPDAPEARPFRTPSLSLDHPSYFGDHETDARIVTAATGRRPSLSRRSGDGPPQQSGLSARASREHSLTMDFARQQQQPVSSPSIGGIKFSPATDEPRYPSSSSNGNARDLLDDSGSLRRSSVSEGQNGGNTITTTTRSSSVSYGTQGLPRVASTSPNVYSYPVASPTPPMPMPGRSGKYDYQRSSPGTKEWNDSPRSVEASGSFTQYGNAMEGRRPLSSRPSLQTFRPELPVVAPEEELSDDMDLEVIPEPIPAPIYHPTRHRSSDADLRPYRQQSTGGADRYRENKRMEEQVRKEEEEKRMQSGAVRVEEEQRKVRDRKEERRRRDELAREAKRRDEDAKRREDEIRRREEDLKRREEEAARAEARQREEEAKAEAKRREEEEEAWRKEEEEERERARLEEIQRKEEARQEDLRRELARQEQLRMEEEAKRESARLRKEEEAKRQARIKREQEAREADRLKREEEARREAARQAEIKKEEARLVAEAAAAREEEQRRRLAEEAEAKRQQEAAEEEKRAEIQLREGELAARRAEVLRREEEEMRLRAEATRQFQEETKRKEEEVKRKEEEARRKEEEVKKKEEEAKRKEEQIRLKEAEARRKDEEMQKKEAETRRKEEEIRRREEDLRRREAELKRREDEAKQREEEKLKEQEKDRFRRDEERVRAQQQEEFRKREEDIRRRAEERKRQDSESSGSYPGTSPTSSSWTSSHRSSTTSHIPSSSPTDRTQTSTPSRGSPASWSTWGTTAASSPYTNGSRPTPGTSSTPKPAATTPRSASASTPSVSPSTPISQAEWARRQAEQAKKQQEAFRKEQERLEMERQARQGRILTKEEVHKLFQTHEIQWSKLATLEELNWDSFPWPMIKKPTTAEDITVAAVSAYVLSPHYPDKTKSDKDRIKEYIRRWHPDRFETKYLTRVTEEDKERVKEGAGTVVRNLNDLLTRTNAPSLFQ